MMVLWYTLVLKYDEGCDDETMKSYVGPVY